MDINNTNHCIDREGHEVCHEVCHEECPICLLGIIETDKITLQCNHIYHKNCIYKWVYEFENHNCPYCRSIINIKYYDIHNINNTNTRNGYTRILKKTKTPNGIILTINMTPNMEYTIMIPFILFNQLQPNERINLYDLIEKVIDPNINDNVRDNVINNILLLMRINADDSNNNNID